MTEPRVAPYPADTRARGWRFELDMEKVKASDTWLRAKSGEVRGALMLLWGEAWQQTPCGSLPADDELVALIIDMPAAKFAKNRAVLMRGWWLAEDGRLYHDTIVERVLGMLEKREKDASRKNLYDKKFKAIRDRDGCACVYCGAKTYLSLDHLIAVSRGGTGDESNLVTACRRCNSVKGARTPDEAGMTFVNEQARALWYAIRSEYVAFGNAFVTREERGNDDTKHQAPSTSTPSLRSGVARGSRLPAPFSLTAEYRDFCRQERPDLDPDAVAAKFADYWHGKPGKAGTKLDWLATWRNWVRDERAAAGQKQQATGRHTDSAEDTQRMLAEQRRGTTAMPAQVRQFAAQLTGRKAA